MKISVVSGGFDPIHSGHISYLKAAAKFGDKLFVLLNSDMWLKKKKDQEFLPFHERKIILESLNFVDAVYDFEDDEIGSCINGLRKIQSMFQDDEIIFCNGGDRDKGNIPEMQVKDILFQFSVGGDDKLNSSSWILKKWRYSSEERIWGSFSNLFTDSEVKVKELVVKPGQGMSFQRHFKRNEIWLVSHGKCVVNFSKSDPNKQEKIQLNKFDQFFVKVLQWHQITNPFDDECRIIEIQFGEETVEDDIERLYYYENKSV